MKQIEKVAPKHVPALGEATRIWWKIGFLSFGGPAAQIALLHREVVETKNGFQKRSF